MSFSARREPTDDGGRRHARTTLRPWSTDPTFWSTDPTFWSTDPTFEPIVLENLAEGELRIVAELVEVLA